MNLPVQRITIGRKPGNTIVLNSSDVSGTHASLTLINPVTKVWEIQDMGSANGTFVDGLKVYRKEITELNQIKLGQTAISWDVILSRNSVPAPEPVIARKPIAPAVQDPSEQDEALREIAWSLKKVNDDYREKKNRMVEIQAQESVNSRIQGLGFPMGAVIGSLAQALPGDFKILGYAGGVISLGFAVSALVSSKKLSKERKKFAGLDDWFKINYVCPHCHTFIQQPFELLEKTKNCRACKKALIP